MTKSIQVFRYEYAPSVATIRQKVGTRKTIKRPVTAAQEFNVNELTELTTVIKNVEGFENGMLGTADYQYLKTVTRHDGKYLEDFTISYRFYINKDLKILIIGGDGDYRDQLRKILAKFFNEETSHITPITILRDPLYSLIQKIKTDGPKKDGKAKNILKKCNYFNADFSAHKGVKKEDVEMFDHDKTPVCVSSTESFKRNFPDCETFSAKMRVYKCNAIWIPTKIEEAVLEMKPSAEFAMGKNPSFEAWIIFVIQTCIKFLPLDEN